MMNLIRLIKLKKLNGELDKLSDAHNFFISQFYNLKQNEHIYKKISNGENIKVYIKVYSYTHAITGVNKFKYFPSSKELACSKDFMFSLIYKSCFKDVEEVKIIAMDVMNNYLNVDCRSVYIY